MIEFDKIRKYIDDNITTVTIHDVMHTFGCEDWKIEDFFYII